MYQIIALLLIIVILGYILYRIYPNPVEIEEVGKGINRWSKGGKDYVETRISYKITYGSGRVKWKTRSFTTFRRGNIIMTKL